MSNIATSIEQSKKLVRLGLDPATSDMWWIDDQLVAKSDKFDVPSNDEETTVHCAWSLSTLLEVMPRGTELIKMRNDVGGLYYEIDYMYTGYEDSDPVTAAYEMVCWLLEQKILNYDNHEKD